MNGPSRDIPGFTHRLVKGIVLTSVYISCVLDARLGEWSPVFTTARILCAVGGMVLVALLIDWSLGSEWKTGRMIFSCGVVALCFQIAHLEQPSMHVFIGGRGCPTPGVIESLITILLIGYTLSAGDYLLESMDVRAEQQKRAEGKVQTKESPSLAHASTTLLRVPLIDDEKQTQPSPLLSVALMGEEEDWEKELQRQE